MENKFPALFFSLSVIGLFLVYVSAGKIDPKTTDIGAIDSSMVGSYAQITGYVESAKFTGNTISVKLSDGYTVIGVMIFSDLKKGLGSDAEEIFVTGSIISVRGLIDEYKGVIQIIPNRVSDIKKLAGK
ncbi:MAG: hypothetical protein HY515_00875 [Candidatus Aenigmarchaeota archaeon]|nr:hypothetical protein [Candidatus Aenigmarchaeota archaeon]